MVHQIRVPKAQASSRPAPSTKSQKNKPREPHPKHQANQDDGYATTDEEEVVYELDEAALSKLPIRLQNNMREIQAERIHRLQKEQRRYLYRRDEDPNQPRGVSYERHYAEKWFSRAIAELDEASKMEVYDMSFGRPQNMTWCPVQRVWVPVTYVGRRKVLDRAAGSGVVRMEDIGGYGKSLRLRLEAEAAPGGNNVTARCVFRGSSYEQYMSWRCSGPYYVYEAGPNRNGYQQNVPSEPRDGSSSFRSAVRNRVRTKIQRVKEIFKK
ncbi:hypothetical protein BDV12DRAFT_194848 [Aspergillus spectabilis]